MRIINPKPATAWIRDFLKARAMYLSNVSQMRELSDEEASRFKHIMKELYEENPNPFVT